MSQFRVCPASRTYCNLACPDGYCEARGHIENANKQEMTTETQPKYPNADTSPERLARIENSYIYWKDDAQNRKEIPPPSSYYEHMLRDLLAMLHEQMDYKSAYTKAVEAASEQLQCGGPYHYLLPLGRSILLDGPKAMADEITRLKSFVDPQGDHKFE